MKVKELFESDIEEHCQECGEYRECNADGVCAPCMEAHKASEEEEWNVKHTGQNTNQSIATLQHQAAAAKRSGNTHRYRQKEFAVRAKQHWK